MRLLRLALDLLLWPAVALTATLAAAAALLAQLGRTSLKWDVLAQFAPCWLLACVCALVACALFRGWRRWSVAVVGLAGLAAAATLIAPEYLRSAGPRAPADAPDQLKLVQFNVWHENPDPQPILAWLDAERPDLVVIEENSPRFSHAVASHGGWSVACPHCEVMILSRTPALAVERAHHGPTAPPAPLTRALFRDRRGLFEVVGVHDSWPTEPDQAYQERRLAEVIDQAGRNRLIVAGDFNSAPWSFARRRWDAVFAIPRRERALPSWPAHTYKRLKWLGLPFLPIDHVYAGPAWATVRVERGPRLTSDHYAVVVTLAPTNPAPGAQR